MSSTNRTLNLGLPQFIGSDKPTWLGDINGAFANIDNAVGGNASEINTIKETLTTVAQNVMRECLRATHPVGSYYISDVPTNPSEIFGGVWQVVKDTFLYACGDTYAAGSTGGEANHRLTVDELPAHNHRLPSNACVTKSGEMNGTGQMGTGNYWSSEGWYNGKGATPSTVKDTGDNVAHNNMPPFKAVYVWVRTA